MGCSATYEAIHENTHLVSGLHVECIHFVVCAVIPRTYEISTNAKHVSACVPMCVHALNDGDTVVEYVTLEVLQSIGLWAPAQAHAVCEYVDVHGTCETLPHIHNSTRA